MNGDLLIKGGTVVDPERGFFGQGDVAVKDGRIIEAPARESKANTTIDAAGCLVLPGLIDFHAHVFAPGSRNSVWADAACLPQGTTTVVDAGTAGSNNYENFVRTVPAFNQMRVFSLINIAPAGLVGLPFQHENLDPKHYDAPATKALFAKYPAQLKGLKVRQSKEVVGQFGLEPLKATVKLADEIGCPVVVHVTNAPCLMSELADVLRPGDVFCHVFHPTGNTILGSDGKLLPGIKAARERGVIFDVANGKSHFSFCISRTAMAEGFFPDIISTDLTIMTLYLDYAFGMSYLMSKFLNLGMELPAVVAASTATPAKLLGMRGQLGTLAPGALADIAVLRQVPRPTRFLDIKGESFVGEQLLVPQMTILGGRVVYRQIDFGT